MAQDRTAAGINAEHERYKRVVTQLTEVMKLRQWAVEKAVELALVIAAHPSVPTQITGINMLSVPPAADIKPGTVSYDPIESAKTLSTWFHDFVSRPAIDAIAEAEKPDAAEGTE